MKSHIFFCAASGEDVAHEHVHHDAAGVHRGPVDRQVYRGLLGLPLRPHHDGAVASRRPPQDLRRTGAQSGRMWDPELSLEFQALFHYNPVPQNLDRLLLYKIEQIRSMLVSLLVLRAFKEIAQSSHKLFSP